MECKDLTMKKAFTLIELMITIAVLVILMGLVFRLTSAGTDSQKRTITIIRMQKLENCLSGYFAAFGCYPPVKLHGTRNIYAKVGAHGIQDADGEENTSLWSRDEDDAWRQVKAACKAQPVDCRFPFPKGMNDRIVNLSEEFKRRAQNGERGFKDLSEERKSVLVAGFDDGFSGGAGNFDTEAIDWRDVQIFKFGLMSYLLPRYLFMMGNTDVEFDDYAQWTGNNSDVYDALEGRKFDSGWKEVKKYANKSEGASEKDYARIANVPSQAVCARWIANLSGVCTANRDMRFFGVNVWNGKDTELSISNTDIEIFSHDDSNAYQYILDSVTVKDGWNHEFYYYSPSPYQHYQLWSGGPNDRTFPPWVDRSQISDTKAHSLIGKWVEDDIVHLSH